MEEEAKRDPKFYVLASIYPSQFVESSCYHTPRGPDFMEGKYPGQNGVKFIDKKQEETRAQKTKSV